MPGAHPPSTRDPQARADGAKGNPLNLHPAPPHAPGRPAPAVVLLLVDRGQPLGDWLGLLSDDERSRADRFVHLPSRRLFVLAHGLKRAALARLTGQPPETLGFGQGAYGKPEIAGPADAIPWHFNLSHGAGQVAFIASRGGPVGIDVDCVNGRTGVELDELADFICHPQELQARPRDDPACVWLTERWCLKEALVKAVGQGLSLPPAHLLVCPAAGRPGAYASRDPQGGEWQLEVSTLPAHARLACCRRGSLPAAEALQILRIETADDEVIRGLEGDEGDHGRAEHASRPGGNECVARGGGESRG